MKLRVALAQIEISPGQPETNFQRVESLAHDAARQGAHLLLLPELWLSGYDLAHAERHVRAFEDDFRPRWEQLARTTDLYMLGSVLAADDAGQPTNTAFVLSSHGEILASYRKVHLFEPMEEKRYLTAGSLLPVFDLPWGRTALAICYDLRFPEPFRHFALQGAVLVLLVAQWPLRRVDHWRLLAQARAVENQYFLAACNRVGQDPGSAPFGGHSLIVGPWGEVLAEGGEQSDLLQAELDLEEVQRVRNLFPVLPDRRQEIYS